MVVPGVDVVACIGEWPWPSSTLVQRIILCWQHAVVVVEPSVVRGDVALGLECGKAAARCHVVCVVSIEDQIVPDASIHAVERLNGAIDEHVARNVHLRSLVVKIDRYRSAALPMEVEVVDEVVGYRHCLWRYCELGLHVVLFNPVHVWLPVPAEQRYTLA